MKIVRVPSICYRLYSKAIWRIPTDEKKVFLTFDDGPTPEVTEYILEQLEKYRARATFFCLGKNAEQQLELLLRIIDQGHLVQSHGYDHISGWTTNSDVYVENVVKAQGVLKATAFRPAYGRITWNQVAALSESFRIYMWSMNTWDFVSDLDCNRMINKLKQSVLPGDIFVFHDSVKAYENVKQILPELLDYLQAEGWKTDILK